MSRPPKKRGGRPPQRPAGGAPKPKGRPKPEGRSAPSDGRPVLYGRNPVFEALRAGRRKVHHLYATETAIAAEDWLGESGVPLDVADAEWLDGRAGTDAHQGVIAVADPYPYAMPPELLAGDHTLIVALDEVTDPQNLGAIARTAECAGASGLVIPRHRSAEVTPSAGKASAGAVEHLKIARVRNLADWLVEVKEAGAWVHGAAMKGTRWTEVDWTGPTVIVLGAEGRGLRPRVANVCDDVVSLPLRGMTESLNVSAAAAALLYEAVRARS